MSNSGRSYSSGSDLENREINHNSIGFEENSLVDQIPHEIVAASAERVDEEVDD